MKAMEQKINRKNTIITFTNVSVSNLVDIIYAAGLTKSKVEVKDKFTEVIITENLRGFCKRYINIDSDIALKVNSMPKPEPKTISGWNWRA